MTVGLDQLLVSIMIIYLNEERYLLQAIHSVRIQDYTNWEWMLVHVDSTDGRAIAEAA